MCGIPDIAGVKLPFRSPEDVIVWVYQRREEAVKARFAHIGYRRPWGTMTDEEYDWWRDKQLDRQ